MSQDSSSKNDSSRKIRIGTRGSDLALWQAQQAQSLCDSPSEIVVIKTHGDRDQRSALADSGGAGLFTKELEEALYQKKIDVAVHSLKDLPVEQPKGLELIAVLKREQAEDCLLIREEDVDLTRVHFLKEKALVGSSSPRRTEQLLRDRGDLRVEPIRGNLPTRIQKVRDGVFQATLLARAGLNRLKPDLSGIKLVELSKEIFLPSPGQGAIAIEARSGDQELQKAFRRAHCHSSYECVRLERRLLKLLGGGCHLAFGAFVSHEELYRYRMRCWLPEYLMPPLPKAYRADRERKSFYFECEGEVEAIEEQMEQTFQQKGPLHGKRLLLTKKNRQGDATEARLNALGAEVLFQPVIQPTLLSKNWQSFQTDLKNACDLKSKNFKNWVILGSAFSLKEISKWRFEDQWLQDQWSSIHWAVIGESLHKQFEDSFGQRAQIVAETGKDLVRKIASGLSTGQVSGEQGAQFFLPRLKAASSDWVDELDSLSESSSLRIQSYGIYEIRKNHYALDEFDTKACIVMSGSALEALFKESDVNRKWLQIGTLYLLKGSAEKMLQRLELKAHKVVVSKVSTVASLVQEIRKDLAP
jgi:hydroxymethylbilane synthase